MNGFGISFPDPRQAPDDGPLAVGGDLSVQTLGRAYAAGIFPWYDASSPILWWCPNPRFVLRPNEVHISHSLEKTLKESTWKVTFDQNFSAVIRACARTSRPGQKGTWITPEMMQAYEKFHEEGYAHSVEVWDGEALVGGLYGVAIGHAFFGESMFHRIPDASKVGFVHLVKQLCKWNFKLIDCQQKTAHLARFGAKEWPRNQFLDELAEAVSLARPFGKWNS
ncbi:leucyl/phenylalanyl-tRNA--protein transferase [Rubellicoccus peritrichatus]|uniref:Leucyl/phenylalanyl-tRNA--protein transferase n=1 Tax=Rubellicoccus peritrichatus TaxID=3080537 RepID=A0AAQ3QS29_9BACT|nr:leucyl/phenylalanyl-tRNA--protein transferase [Puniceicoccus sp. CR14]WOO41948.1 leucyl/phenylalanyl-tRNA--protein transferase [Puniceicoccus sp. CR14]